MTTKTLGDLELAAGWIGEDGQWRGWFTVRRGDEMLLMGSTRRVAEHAYMAADAAMEIAETAANELLDASDELAFHQCRQGWLSRTRAAEAVS